MVVFKDYQSMIYELAIKTAKLLQQNTEQLNSMKWNEGEANLDFEFSLLSCNLCNVCWNDMKSEYQDVIELICTPPDINITIRMKNKQQIKSKIELKSSLKHIMSGSCINNLDINQPIIFCLRNKKIEIKCCQYYQAIEFSDTDLCFDRSPRPKLNWKLIPELQNCPEFQTKEKIDWIEHYSNCILNRNKATPKSWQDTLHKIIINQSIKNYIQSTSVNDFINDKILYS